MVRVFKGLENKKKAYYAVTDTGDINDALHEVVDYKKVSFCKFVLDTKWEYGTIAPYVKGFDGLWFAKDKAKGEPCIIVYK